MKSDLDKWSRALKHQMEGKIDDIPEGWTTCRDLAAKLGKSAVHVRVQLAEMVAEGKADMKKFRVRLSNSRIALSPHYKLK